MAWKKEKNEGRSCLVQAGLMTDSWTEMLQRLHTRPKKLQHYVQKCLRWNGLLFMNIFLLSVLLFWRRLWDFDLTWVIKSLKKLGQNGPKNLTPLASWEMRLTDSLTLQCKQAFPLCFEVASINLRLAEKKHQFSSQGNASFSNAFKVHFLRKIMYYFRAQGMTLTFGPIPNSESSVIVQKYSCWQKKNKGKISAKILQNSKLICPSTTLREGLQVLIFKLWNVEHF